jgi:hypothetical protein
MTAVEQFFKDLVHLGYIEYPNENLLQDRLNLALEMEKQQHELTWEKSGNGSYQNISFEKYYYETYKKDKI